jgi:ABC-2 type transport system ATP-binding protein
VVQRVAAVLQSEEIAVKDLGLRRPTLDDVFLDLTGSSATTDTGTPADGGRGQPEAAA